MLPQRFERHIEVQRDHLPVGRHTHSPQLPGYII